ncbi:conserved hypothetical protein [Talaromyces stipitatus ATCC 10500]|uniref:Zn(2)-C6 fungal-type domain-containing protein n=1 Tax=Talaromyces stipitatus (strain ATCC 10500 / CBS 375.48 / QM 6759 / NRRL 1006) TaxID=441959 RepID=B8MC70_TALSN|nr:uncharacterized protein TSTA_122490 [Talaromyces stipitatus ATCC 10500]EED18516.1 conserved hypothetical protein [Talaromyces stipitatus ATCC 10500]
MENACKPCATAKRKCERQTPQCARCRRRGIECTYPPAKQTAFILCEDDHSSAQEHGSISYVFSSDKSTYTRSETLPLPSWPCTVPAPSDIGLLAVSATRLVASDQLMSYVAMLRTWLTQWVDQGSNPFIHASLYKARMPSCMQDAYTALSSYFLKNPTNEQTIYHILEDRLQRLVDTQGVEEYGPAKRQHDLNSIDHLARVQSLLIFVVMALFDGDIRLRHFAESYIPVLEIWVEAMIDHTNQMLSLSVGPEKERQLYYNLNVENANDRQNLNWHCWVIAESTQRTWMMAAGVQAIYSIMQSGKAPPCRGHMVITTRPGVWEASSALAWSRLCLETNTGIIQMSEADRLFAEAAPEEVDDFTRVFLEATYGKDRMERWVCDREIMTES